MGVISAVEKNEAGKNEVVDLQSVIREGLSAEMMFSRIPSAGEGVRLTLQFCL